MIHNFLELVIPEISAALELIGVIIIVLAAFKAVYNLLVGKLDFGDDSIKLKLAQALAMGLEFKLAGEILKTVIIKTIDEFFILAAIAILRVTLTFVIHWEIKDGVKVIEETEELCASKGMEKK